MIAAVLAFYFDGAIRKWALSPESMWIQPVAAAKLLFAGLAVILAARTLNGGPLESLRTKLVTIPLFLVTIGAAIAGFNEMHLLGAILTLIPLVIVPYIAMCVPAIISPNGIRACLMLSAAIMIGMAPLVFIQYFSNRDDWINVYVGGSSIGVSSTGFDDRVRATGTFTYITGLTIGSVVGQFSGIYLYSTSSGKSAKAIAIAAVVASLFCGLATVSRGALLANFAMLIAWAVFSKGLATKVASAFCLAFFSGISYFANASSLAAVIGAVFERSANAGDTYYERITNIFVAAWEQASETPMGAGLGMTQNVAHGFYYAGVETEAARLIFEVGIIGFVGYSLIYWGAVTWLVAQGIQSANPLCRAVCINCAAVCALLAASGVIFNHVTTTAFWAVFGAGAYLIEYGYRHSTTKLER